MPHPLLKVYWRCNCWFAIHVLYWFVLELPKLQIPSFKNFVHVPGKPDPTSPTTSQATTVPGDDAEAKKMAVEGNNARLAEMEREAYQKRKAPQTPGSDASKTTITMDDCHDKAAEKVEKLRRVGSQEIFQDKQSTSAKTMPTSATAVPTTRPAGKGPRKLKGKGTCAKKGKSKCKKTTTKKKQHAGSKAATLKNPPEKALPPTKAPVGEATLKVKEEPGGKAVATPARSQVAPPVTPVPASQTLPRSDTGDLVRDMLNRAATQEQMTPTSSQLPDKPAQTEQTRQNQPATPSEETKPARKPRDPALHRRKMKFYRSLESQGLVSTRRDFIWVVDQCATILRTRAGSHQRHSLDNGFTTIHMSLTMFYYSSMPRSELSRRSESFSGESPIRPIRGVM